MVVLHGIEIVLKYLRSLDFTHMQSIYNHFHDSRFAAAPDAGQNLHKRRVGISHYLFNICGPYNHLNHLPCYEYTAKQNPIQLFCGYNLNKSIFQHGFLDYLATQRFVHSMDEEFLDAEGMTYDMPRKSADYAVGSAEITGSDGATVAVGAICKIANYAEYAVTKASPIMDGLGTVTLKALIAGQAGNVPAGTELRFVETIPGVNSIVTVGEDGLRGGVDAENNEDYRERILDRKREPPHGGNKHDYEVWAKEVPGVTRVWCLPLWLGLGTVGVMFVRDYDADIFPTEEQCQKVWSHIEEERPVTASEICVFAPVKQEINIVTKLSPDGDAIRQAVIKELTDFIIREGKPSEVPEEGTYIHGSRLSEAISVAVGEHHHSLDDLTNDIHVPRNAVPVLGTVTFIENKMSGV